MNKKVLTAIIIAALVIVCGVGYLLLKKDAPQQVPEPPAAPVVAEEPKEIDPVQYNLQQFDNCLEDIVTAIAYSSGFSENTYVTGERYAYGFSNTVVGRRLVRDGETTVPKQAYETTVNHLKDHVKPFFKHIKRQLTDCEIIAVAHFMYNVGGERFSGYSEEGEQVCKPSKLFTAINNNESAEVCARYFTGFRSAGGMIHEGLLKLRWLQAAIYTENITPQDLKTANVVGIFGMNIAGLYEHRCPDKDGYYTPKFDAETVSKVLEQKGIGISTEELLKF